MTEQNPTNPPATSRRRTSRRPAVEVNVWNTLSMVIMVAALMASLFTLWTPSNLFNNQLVEQMMLSAQNKGQPDMRNWPTPTLAPRPHIGIIAGHFGYDSGAVCESDGLQEVKVNLMIAGLVQQNLIKKGFDVDLLQEFDDRLFQYQALALVSIHNDSCDYINDQATGYKVAIPETLQSKDYSNRLLACMIDRYAAATKLRFHAGSITPDMTRYHNFGEINILTPAAIIETGFLNLDRQFLTEHTDKVAQGITEGILCFIQNEPVKVNDLNNP